MCIREKQIIGIGIYSLFLLHKYVDLESQIFQTCNKECNESHRQN
ncbi:hypothetical protein V3I05_06125 [Helicobacter mastomyrinus]|uniref:Uncharacterized protein n=1 Tax=Helicobacter mastomyrinus TaxID=287948 RepID=A0ABZ3F553_9HELI